MSDITAKIFLVNVSLSQPRVFNLDDGFIIATCSDYENPADIVISNKNWLTGLGTAMWSEFFAAVKFNKQANGKFSLSLDSRSRNHILHYRKAGGEQLKSFDDEMLLENGDVFDFGVNSYSWNSEGDCGLATFQIRYELEREVTQEKDGLENSVFNKLPDEIILQIFKHVPVEDVVLTLPSVCLKFFDVITKMGVKKETLNLVFGTNAISNGRDFFFPCESGLISRLINVVDLITLKVDVTDHVDVVNFISNVCSLIGPKCVQLRFDYAHVWFENNREDSLSSNQCFKTLLTKLQNSSKVRSFVFSWYGTTNGLDSASEWPLVPRVKNLSLTFNSDFETVKDEHIFNTFPNVDSLVLKDVKNRATSGFWNTFGINGRAEKLKRLTMTNFPQTVPWAGLEELEALHMSAKFICEAEDFFRETSACFLRRKNLRHFFASLPRNVSRDQLLGFLNSLPKNLRTLCLDFGFVQLDAGSVEQAIRTIGNRCSNLETIVLNAFGSVSTNDLVFLFNACGRLQEVVYEEDNSRFNFFAKRELEHPGQVFLVNRNSSTVDDIRFLFFPI